MRFLLTLLVIAGVICGWFVLQDKRAEANLTGWAKQLSTHLEPQVGGRLKQGAPAEADEANFFKLLYFLYRVENAKLDVNIIVSQALEQLGITDEKEAVTKNSLLANFEMAKKLRIFDDTSNLIKLEQGEAALVMLKGWDGEPVGLGHIIPPAEAPEIANALPNLVLLPVPIRDAQSGTPPNESADRVRDLERGGFITKGTVDRLLGVSKKAR